MTGLRITQKIVKATQFKCAMCGWERLQKRYATYVKHTYRHSNPKPYVEHAPVCQDCARKIGTDLFDGWEVT